MGEETQATLVGVDEENDLAVLHIKAEKLTAIRIGAPRNAQVGDVVLAIGNPFGMGQTVTQGIISATGRQLDWELVPWRISFKPMRPLTQAIPAEL